MKNGVDPFTRAKIKPIINRVKINCYNTQPSILLQHIKDLAGNGATDTLVKSACLQLLSERTQDILRTMLNNLHR